MNIVLLVFTYSGPLELLGTGILKQNILNSLNAG